MMTLHEQDAMMRLLEQRLRPDITRAVEAADEAMFTAMAIPKPVTEDMSIAPPLWTHLYTTGVGNYNCRVTAGMLCVAGYGAWRIPSDWTVDYVDIVSVVSTGYIYLSATASDPSDVAPVFTASEWKPAQTAFIHFPLARVVDKGGGRLGLSRVHWGGIAYVSAAQ